MIKKILYCIAVALMIMPNSFVFATGTRDMGLGLFEYPWFIDGLQTYIYENPSYLGRFTDKIYAERIGITDGKSRGGVIYNPKGNFFIGVDLGLPVDTNLWNTTAVDSLFHVDVYSAKGVSKYTHSVSPQAMKAYQVELLDKSILDLKDPVDASEVVGAAITSPNLREPLNQRNLSLLLSYNFNKFSLGWYAGYATSWKQKRNSDSATNSHEEYNLINAEYSTKLGINIVFNNKVSSDIAGYFYLYQLDNNYMQRKPGIDYDMSYKSKGAMDFGGNVRLNYAMTQNQKIHFYVNYAMLNRSTEGKMLITDTGTPANNCDAQDTFERKGQKIGVGVSDEISVNEGMVVYIGFLTNAELFENNYYGKDAITPANNVDKYNLEYKAIEVPIIVGLEAKLSENWKGRFGVVQKIYKPLTQDGKNITGQGTKTSPTSINETASSTSTLNVGLSYKLDNFTFDWLMNVELFTVGPYIVSGKAWTSGNENPLAFAFAATYNFATASQQ